MANIIVLNTTYSSDHTISTITDATTYTNPVRGAASVSLEVYKIDYRGNETPITITPDTEDPLTVSSWTFPLSVDGQYRYRYYLSDVITETIDLVIYEITQDKRDRAAINASLEQDMDAQRDKHVNNFRLLDIMVEGMKEANVISEYNKGERIARSAQGL